MKKAILMLFLTLLALKLLLIPLVTVPLGFSDSLAYFEQAKAFYETGSIKEVIETAKFPPLYAMVISPSYFSEDMETVFFVMKIINAIISSLVIIPASLLAREFMSKKKSLMVATITAFLPGIFSMTFYVLSENLFLPLFLFAVYFVLKTYTDDKKYWSMLAGATISFCLLTRVAAVVFIPLLILMTLLHIKKRWKKMASTLLWATLTILPWLIVKGTQTKASTGAFQGYNAELFAVINIPYLPTKILWSFLYLDYLIIGAGIIIFILSLSLLFNYKSCTNNEKLFLIIVGIITICTIALAANNSGNVSPYTDHRVIGRYLITLFPLLIPLSFLALEKEVLKKKVIVGTAGFILVVTPLIIFGTFFPINNTEWIPIELLKLGTNYPSVISTILITSILTLITLSFLGVKQWKTKTYATIIIIYFITVSMLNTSAIVYDTNVRWIPIEEVQLGRWISENIPPEATFYFDPNDLEYFEEGTTIDRTNENDRPVTIIAYWIRGNIVNSGEILHKTEELTEEYEYLITTKELDLEKVREGETIIIYKVP